MLQPKRHALILREIAEQPAVSTRQLTEILGVSRETVRKDIEHLAKDNKLTQVRGGATSIRNSEYPLAERTMINWEGKVRIAKFIAGKIPDGASIIIDNGSSTLAVAQQLSVLRKKLIIYTNDLKIAETLEPASQEIILLGGRYDVSEKATFGLDTIAQLKSYRAEFALVAAGGISAEALFTDFSREAADLRNIMIHQAKHQMILVDESKFDVVGKVVLKPLPQSAEIVFDCAPPEDIRRALSDHAVSIAF
ncbi:MAG: DeoR/GlpR family DNA-binding transcription regulator [Sulfitobacter sp.]